MRNISNSKISYYGRNRSGFLNNPRYKSDGRVKTKPNNRYYSSELKKITNEFLLSPEGQRMKEEDPARYYSMKGQKIPKKHKKPRYPIAPVNAYVPEQSKLSYEDLQIKLERDLEKRKQQEAEDQKRKQMKRVDQERQKRNQETYAREQRYIYWCNPNESINKNKLGSSMIIRNKKYDYYY